MENSTTTESHECFSVVENLRKKLKTDDGFSGYLHAITGVVAVEIFFLVALIAGWGTEYVALNSLAMIVAFALAWIGATLYPDLDNSKSTSHSALGFIGEGLSIVFRFTSGVIQTVVRTSKDDASPNPHRGFYHTLLSAALIGTGIWMLTKLTNIFELPIVGEVSLGQIFAALFLAVMVHLFLSALAKSHMKKIRKGMIAGELVAFLLSSSIALLLMYFIPESDGYLWLGIAIAGGGATHIIGDAFTRYGVPLFFPLTVLTRKKFWWYIRFAKLESGGDIEKYIIIGCSIASFIMFIAIMALAFI